MTVIDPVCGMSIDEKGCRSHNRLWRQNVFLSAPPRVRPNSTGTLKLFSAPKQHPFLVSCTEQRASSTPVPCTRRYVRPQPGSCPKCGMALEPVTPSAPSKTEWTCPMHPEVVRDAPGTCPICGMALEPRTACLREENPELIDMTRRFRVSLVSHRPVVCPGHVPTFPMF